VPAWARSFPQFLRTLHVRATDLAAGCFHGLSQRTTDLGRNLSRLPRAGQPAHVCAGFFSRVTTAAGAGHAELSPARSGAGPHHHRLPELGRSGLRLQVVLGSAGGPAAHSLAHALAGPAAQLVVAVSGAHHGVAGGHGAVRSAHRAQHGGLVRTRRGLRFGHAGHRARRLPHRVGRRAPPGRSGRYLPDRLPPGHDLGRRGRAVDRGARRGGARGCRGGRRGGRAGRALPAGRVDHGLPGDGGEHAGGCVHRAVLARTGACGLAARKERGRLVAQRPGRALRRLPQALWQAGVAHPCADRRLPQSATW
jgi:hypothetical protein